MEQVQRPSGAEVAMMTRPAPALASTIAALLLSWQAQAQTTETVAPQAKEEVKRAPAQLAEQPAAQSSPPAVAPAAVVNVVAERQTNRIDRQVYDIKNDASTAGASVGDVLNNVPSVNVDPNGTVRIRGSERVTVLVDGKPTAQLQGDNRAAAINALPAENYESVQVINNPGAEFGNEAGGGPILNLISRRYTKPGGNGSVAGNVGPAGRKNAFANGSYSAGYASVNGSFNYRRDGNETETDNTRERIDPASGSVSRLHQTAQRSGLADFIQGGVGGRYNYNQRDTLTGSLSVNKRGNNSRSNEHLMDFGTGSLPLADYLTRRSASGDALNHEIVAGWERRFNTDGENLKVDLRHSSNTNNVDTAAVYQPITLPAIGAPALRDYTQNAETRVRLTDLSTDYSGKAGSGFLTAGGRWQRTRQASDYRYLFLDTGALDAKRSNLFDLRQDVSAGYATYEMPLNTQWSFKGGLRVERTELSLDQVSTNVRASNSYTNYLPSLFLTYKLDKFSNLRVSFSDRISRPAAGDLNPFVNYASEYAASSGNPYLHPVKLHSLELGYETKIMGLMPASLRGYVRHETDVITERRTFISPTMLLTTKENNGNRDAAGVEFSIMAMVPPNMKWHDISLPAIRFMFNGNWGFVEQDRLGMLGPTGEKRRTPSLHLQGGAQWTITPQDTLTFMTFHQGKQLSGEGYREPYGIVNLALEHKYTPRLSLNIRANDAFQSADQRYRVETDTLRERTDVTVHQRRVYVGLRYTFGGVTGNDAVRNALQAAGVNPDSQVAKDAMRMMQGQQNKPSQPDKPVPEKKD
jgi:outer membrane receptor protein involved in Fe transport